MLILEGNRFVECNAATVAMLRAESQEAVLRAHPSELSPTHQPDGRLSYEKAEEMIRRTLESGSHRFEWIHRRMDGELFPVEVLSSVLDASGEQPILHVSWHEITERKRLAAELREAQKLQAVGSLAAEVAHDFNNLLVVIQAAAAELEAGLGTQEELRGDVEQLVEASNRASDLTTKLMAFTRQQALMQSTHEVDDLLTRVEPMLRRVFSGSVELELVRPRKEMPVQVDAAQLDQALLSLAVNARDALADGGRVRVGARPHCSDVVFFVEDTGEGMSEEVLQRAAEPFFTTRPSGKGVGLGLTGATRVVEQHGGHLVLNSRPGEGTCAELHFPASVRRSARDLPQGPARPAPETSGARTILLAEDEPAVAAVLVRVLERAGYIAIHAENGAVALERLEALEGKVDLVVTDAVMPVMGGVELIAQLRARYPGVPFLLTSGYTTPTHLLADDVPRLMKPFPPAVLRGAIEQLLTHEPEAPG